MPIWGREPFVMPAIVQATTMLVDDLVLSVSCLHPELEQFEDSSETIARGCALGLPNVHYVSTKPDYRLRFADGMVRLLNSLLDVASPEENDLIWLLDVDEFYFQETVDEALSYIEEHPEFTSIRFASRFIAPDVSHYIEHGHTRLHRYWEGRQFASESMLMPLDESVVLGQSAPMHHFSMAIPLDYKETFWRVEFGLPAPAKQEKKCRWLREVYAGYDVENEGPWIDKNASVTGHSGFWFADDCGEKDGGGLKVLDGPHPPAIGNSVLIDRLGDFRKFVYHTKRAPVQRPTEEVQTSRKLKIGSQEKEMTPLLAGPWAGEFGYELMFWIPMLKAVSNNFEAVTVIVPRGHEVLYQHVTQSIITHGIDLGESRWKANAGDAKFWFGEWEGLADRRVLDELALQVQDRVTSSVVLEPIPELFNIPGEYVRYGEERPREGIALHCRRAGHGRDWPDEYFDALAADLNASGITPKIIGTLSDYLPKGASVVDKREDVADDIGKTIGHICSSSMVVGASSGVMHLASLCRIPHLVWGDEGFPIPEIGTSRQAYESRWNPFVTRVKYIPGGWFPEVATVLKAVLMMQEAC